MTDNIRIIQVEFFSIASMLLQVISEEFRSSTDVIDRREDENVFQMIRSKYCVALKQVLGQKAALMIDKCQLQKDKIRLQASLAEYMRYFETEFMRKANEI